MPSKRPLSRLRDIRDNALSIREYVGAMDESAFLSNKLIRDASERCLSRISEAAVKLGPVAEELLPGEDCAPYGISAMFLGTIRATSRWSPFGS